MPLIYSQISNRKWVLNIQYMTQTNIMITTKPIQFWQNWYNSDKSWSNSDICWIWSSSQNFDTQNFLLKCLEFLQCAVVKKCEYHKHLKCLISNICIEHYWLITNHQRSYEKVMFSLVYVLFTGGWSPLVTITHDALDPTIQGSPSSPACPLWWPRPEILRTPLVLISGGWLLEEPILSKQVIRILLGMLSRLNFK